MAVDERESRLQEEGCTEDVVDVVVDSHMMVVVVVALVGVEVTAVVVVLVVVIVVIMEGLGIGVMEVVECVEARSVVTSVCVCLSVRAGAGVMWFLAHTPISTVED